MIRFAAAFTTALLLVSCSARPAATVNPADQRPIREGALSFAESEIGTMLEIAQASIAAARRRDIAGALPDALKLEVNELIRTFNATRQTWLVYRAAELDQEPAALLFDLFAGSPPSDEAIVDAMTERAMFEQFTAEQRERVVLDTTATLESALERLIQFERGEESAQ